MRLQYTTLTEISKGFKSLYFIYIILYYLYINFALFLTIYQVFRMLFFKMYWLVAIIYIMKLNFNLAFSSDYETFTFLHSQLKYFWSLFINQYVILIKYKIFLSNNWGKILVKYLTRHWNKNWFINNIDWKQISP